jgi:hypothetical protein
VGAEDADAVGPRGVDAVGRLVDLSAVVVGVTAKTDWMVGMVGGARPPAKPFGRIEVGFRTWGDRAGAD